MYTQAPSELASSGRTRGCLDRKIRLLFGVWASAARKAGPRRAREAGLLWAAVTLEHAAGGGSRTRVAQGPGQSRGAKALLWREAPRRCQTQRYPGHAGAGEQQVQRAFLVS